MLFEGPGRLNTSHTISRSAAEAELLLEVTPDVPSSKAVINTLQAILPLPVFDLDARIEPQELAA